MNATYQSIEELLQWFAVEPRTKRWDAMLAFDQSTVNTLLLQQYIERFNSDSYLPPVNTSIDLGISRACHSRTPTSMPRQLPSVCKAWAVCGSTGM
jgi:hypothetical protein